MYLIPEDVIPGYSKAIGIICALQNYFYPELYLSREDDDDDDGGSEKLAWGRTVDKNELFCSLKANNLKTGTKH